MSGPGGSSVELHLVTVRLWEQFDEKEWGEQDGVEVRDAFERREDAEAEAFRLNLEHLKSEYSLHPTARQDPKQFLGWCREGDGLAFLQELLDDPSLTTDTLGRIRPRDLPREKLAALLRAFPQIGDFGVRRLRAFLAPAEPPAEQAVPLAGSREPREVTLQVTMRVFDAEDDERLVGEEEAERAAVEAATHALLAAERSGYHHPGTPGLALSFREASPPDGF